MKRSTSRLLVVDPHLSMRRFRQILGDPTRSGELVCVGATRWHREVVADLDVRWIDMPAASAADWHAAHARVVSGLERLEEHPASHAGIEIGRTRYTIELPALMTARVRHLGNYLWVVPALRAALAEQNFVVTVASDRAEFADTVASICARHGVWVDRLERAPATSARTPTRASSVERAKQYLEVAGATTRERLLAFADEVPWVLVGDHRQTQTFLDALDESSSSPFRASSTRIMGLFERTLNLVPPRIAFDAQAWMAAVGDVAADLVDATDREIFEGFCAWCLGEFPGWLQRCAALLRALELLRPAMVLSTEWLSEYGSSYRAWCRAHNRPFAVLQHGFQMGTPLSPATRKVRCDVLYCWSQLAAQHVDTRGGGPSLVVTGNPVYAGLEPAHLSGDSERLRVLVAPSTPFDYHLDHYQTMWDDIFAVMASDAKSVEWTVRLHRHSPLAADITQRARALGATVSGVDRETIIEALHRSDVLVTSVSSAIVDGVMAGVPVIVLNRWDEPEWLSTIGACENVASADALRNALRRFQEEPHYRKTCATTLERVRFELSAAHPIETIRQDIARRLAR